MVQKYTPCRVPVGEMQLWTVLAPGNNSRNKSQLSLMKSISQYQSPLAGLEGFSALIYLHHHCVSALLEPVILAKRNKCCKQGLRLHTDQDQVLKTLYNYSASELGQTNLASFKISYDLSKSNSIFTSFPNSSINSVVLTLLTKHIVTFNWSSKLDLNYECDSFTEMNLEE